MLSLILNVVNLTVLHLCHADHLIHALPAICSSLASLFTAILRHGYMPKPIRDCTIVPIPRSNKDPSSSDDYHPIALASTLSKALEWCILLSYPLTSGLQFGFKQKMSTTLTLSLITCMRILLSMPASLMPQRHLILWITRYSLKDYLTESFLLILFASFHHGTRSSACVSGGGTPYLIVSLSLMVSGKVVYFLQFFLLSVLMTSWVTCASLVLGVTGTLFLLVVCYADGLVLLAFTISFEDHAGLLWELRYYLWP